MALLARLNQGGGQFVVIGEYTRGDIAQGHNDSAGQCRDIDNLCRVIAADVRQRIT